MPTPGKPSRPASRPWTRLFVLAAAALTVVGVVGCDARSAPAAVGGTSAPRQATVVGEGKVDGTPDTLTISLSIAATAPDAIGASNQTSSRTNAVTEALAGQGIDRKDISTTTVTLQPQYAGSDGTTVTGFQSSNSIEVKVRKIETGPPVLGVIATAGGDATRINSVAYSIEDDSQLVKDARARAFADAKNRGQQYADLAGLELGKALSITETGSGAQPPMPSPTTARFDVAESVPLSPGQQTVGFSVTVAWELD